MFDIFSVKGSQQQGKAGNIPASEGENIQLQSAVFQNAAGDPVVEQQHITGCQRNLSFTDLPYTFSADHPHDPQGMKQVRSFFSR